jgi:hypothetical protein
VEHLPAARTVPLPLDYSQAHEVNAEVEHSIEEGNDSPFGELQPGETAD